MFTASAPTTSPVPSLTTRRVKALITAPEPAPALTPPSIPDECRESAESARPGDTVLVTTEVLDGTGSSMYRVLDRFIRTDDDCFRWVPNVGTGPTPALSLVASRTWGSHEV